MENSIAPTMRSIRVVMVLLLDSRLLIALLTAFFVSVLFACMVIAYVGLTRKEDATKEDDRKSARLAGRITSGFQFGAILAFTVFAIWGREASEPAKKPKKKA